MHTIGYVVGTAVLLFIAYMLVRVARGLSTAKHLHLFGIMYTQAYQRTGSRLVALEEAFCVFRTCPGLRELTAEETQTAVVVLALAPDPLWIVEKVMLKMDSRGIARAFRDPNFLTKLVDVGIRREADRVARK